MSIFEVGRHIHNTGREGHESTVEKHLVLLTRTRPASKLLLGTSLWNGRHEYLAGWLMGPASNFCLSTYISKPLTPGEAAGRQLFHVMSAEEPKAVGDY